MAGPIALATVALLALAGVPPMKAVTWGWRLGLPAWVGQAVLCAWPAWALRRRLLPEAWCVQLRCLPLPARAQWAGDLAVSAAILAPLAALYLFSAASFAIARPRWWRDAWPAAIASLAASWAASWLLGAAAFAWQRRGVAVRARRAPAARDAAALPGVGPRLAWALLWTPWWRGAMTPSGAGLAAGMAVAVALAVAWTAGRWPVVPGAAWAFGFSALLVALTERAQRAMDGHADALAPWLAALPVDGGWRRRARAIACAPMMLSGAAAVALVALAPRPFRAVPLAAFAVGLVATPLALTAVHSSRRETHVGLWAVCTGLLTALGSELWN
ncbi:MAG: hypothetical protein ACTHL8_00350 [Burkholderiaceae bacterium]